MKVSTLNRPRNVPLALPPPLVSRSPWYQERPNGKFGTWITNTSNSVLAGKPQALTSSLSTGPRGVTVTLALALRRQPALVTAAERTMSNLSGASACAGEASAAPQASAAVNPSSRHARVEAVSFPRDIPFPPGRPVPVVEEFLA